MTKFPDDLVFRPEQFWMGRTEGWGLMRQRIAPHRRRCHVVTEGSPRASYGMQMTMTFTYLDGELDVWRWVLNKGPDNRYMVAEGLAGAGIIGAQEGEDFVLTFRRALPRLSRLFRAKITCRLSLLASDQACQAITVEILGVKVAEMVIFLHKRDGGA